MPRLSIIVPFQQDDSNLESTLLSLLENRPSNIEILLAHDGTYTDPYGLGSDELVLVDCEPGTNSVGLINQALAASCSAVVEVLIPGTTVVAGWTDAALNAFEDRAIAAVSPVTISDNAAYFGIDAQYLPRRALVADNHRVHECVPLLNGGFFRRRTLLALDGFLDIGSREAADVEFGLAIHTLGFEAVLDPDSYVSIPKSILANHTGAYALGQLTGQLALAYSMIEGSDIVIESLMTRLGRLATGLMNPTAVADRLGWVFGIRDRSLVATIAERIERADNALSRDEMQDDSSRFRKAA